MRRRQLQAPLLNSLLLRPPLHQPLPPPPPGPPPWWPRPAAVGAWMPHRPPGSGRRRGLRPACHWLQPPPGSRVQHIAIAPQGPQKRLPPPQAPLRQTDSPAAQTPPARQPGTAAVRLAPPWHWWWGRFILRDPTSGVQHREPAPLPAPPTTCAPTTCEGCPRAPPELPGSRVRIHLLPGPAGPPTPSSTSLCRSSTPSPSWHWWCSHSR